MSQFSSWNEVTKAAEPHIMDAFRLNFNVSGAIVPVIIRARTHLEALQKAVIEDHSYARSALVGTPIRFENNLRDFLRRLKEEYQPDDMGEIENARTVCGKGVATGRSKMPLGELFVFAAKEGISYASLSINGRKFTL